MCYSRVTCRSGTRMQIAGTVICMRLRPVIDCHTSKLIYVSPADLQRPSDVLTRMQSDPNRLCRPVWPLLAQVSPSGWTYRLTCVAKSKDQAVPRAKAPSEIKLGQQRKDMPKEPVTAQMRGEVLSVRQMAAFWLNCASYAARYRVVDRRSFRQGQRCSRSKKITVHGTQLRALRQAQLNAT